MNIQVFSKQDNTKSVGQRKTRRRALVCFEKTLKNNEKNPI